ncbi:ABC transporter permease [Dyadobacter chenwenxiniae]|uniref:ABC transporter permease n=1 Tax=Dyadobacter chenwenxiniae TaxID=2906456 RepID=A0A9X1TE30_9BACT|nr:ABC transporter permease [Dyadobacter chenwenxiniae]MCF0061030.1 ABC transporter permease [Dyadobacter chenwenxiniae]UON80858.1 ABC transporter permease [Dyadobacter chenwenxiniae]
MLKNHLKIALRTVIRYRNYTVLNVLGLSVGVAACLLLYVVYTYESGFDKFHSKADRIYRIVRQNDYPTGQTDYTPGSPLPYYAALKVDMPQIGTIVPVWGTLEPQVTILGKDANNQTSKKKFYEDNDGLLTVPEFFDLFDFPFLIGSRTVLKDPNVIVLSQRRAEKYFGKWQEAMGQYVKINNKTVMKVGGIIANPPLNTDFPIDIVVSYESKRQQPLAFGFGGFESWGGTSSNDQLFVLLPENVAPASINKLFVKFVAKHYNKKENAQIKQFLAPLADQHHDKRFINYADHIIDRNVLWTLVVIGVLIIAMACINFINLATVQSARRSREVGVRKVLGSGRAELMRQFLSETVLIVGFAVLLGVIIAMLCMPLLGKISRVPVDLPVIQNPEMWLFVIGLALIVSFIAGFYPAVVMSGFKPIEAIKSKIANRSLGGVSLQKTLIIVQFGISQILVVGTIVTIAQMNYIGNLDLGFVKEGVYNVNLDDAYKSRFEAFRNELEQSPDISSVSFSSDVPSSDNNWSGNFAFGNRGKDEDFQVFNKFADQDYFQTYGFEFVAGGPYQAGDSVGSCVVNETFLAKVGIKNPQEGIGKNLRMGGGEWQPIVGVVKDFKANSARDAAKPIVIMPMPQYYWMAGVKIKTQNVSKAVASIEKIYSQVFPEVALQGKFFDQSIEEFYNQERQLSLLYQIFAGLSIFIACLGLFGLATFMAQQRMKEIGVRKVLGASVSSIVGLLSRDFLMLVFIAILLASPVAWYFMDKWLQDFEYKIHMSWWMFAVSAVLAILIAFTTVSFQSIKAALMNPVKSLRSD